MILFSAFPQKIQAMKKIGFSMLIILFTAMRAFTQLEGGAIMLGTSTSLWDQTGNKGSLIFSQYKEKVGDETTEGPKTTAFNLSSRVGFNLVQGLVAGVRANFTYNETKHSYDGEDYKSKETGIYGGPFVRYYFNSAGKVKPFIEGEAAFGRIKDDYGDDHVDKLNIMQLAGGAGIGIFLSDCVSFDVMAGYGHTSITDPDDESDAKVITSGFGGGIGFTFFLK